MLSPSPSITKKKIAKPVILAAKVEAPLFVIDIEQSTKDSLVTYCLEQLSQGREELFFKSIAFYKNEFHDLEFLKKAIEKNLITRLKSHKNDSFILPQIQSWLKNLEKNEKAPFIDKLNKALLGLWTKRDLSKRASQLTRLLQNEGDGEIYRLQEISQKAFSYAQANDDMQTLLFILPFMKQWHFEPKNTPQIVSCCLADAEYLFEQARFNEAYDKVTVALFFDQENLKAHLLAQKIEASLTEMQITCLEYPASYKN